METIPRIFKDMQLTEQESRCIGLVGGRAWQLSQVAKLTKGEERRKKFFLPWNSRNAKWARFPIVKWIIFENCPPSFHPEEQGVENPEIKIICLYRQIPQKAAGMHLITE